MATAAELMIILKARDDASRVLRGVGGELNTMQKMAIGAGTAGAVAIAGFGAASVKMAADFEQGMAEVKSLLPDLSDQAFGKVKSDVLDLSKEIGVATNQAVPALYQAISAGVPADNAISFMTVASKAAIAGASDMETAIDGITTAVNAWKMPMSEAGHVADVMFQGVKLGKFTMEELSASMFQAAPLAATLGVGFEDVIGGVTTLTKFGTPASVAMTQVRASMVALATPNATMIELLKRSGYESGEALLKHKGLAGALGVLREASAGNNAELGKAFGSVEALQAALGLTGDNAAMAAADLDAMRNSTGAADAAFNVMTDTAAFKTQKALNVLRVEMIEIGTRALPLVAIGAELAGRGLMYLSEIVGAVVKAGAVLVGFFNEHRELAIGLAAALVVVLLPAVIALTVAVYAQAVAFATAAIAAALAYAPLLLIAAGVGLLIAAILLLIKHWDTVWAAMKAAPAALLAWLKTHFIDVLIAMLGPAGWAYLIVKNWDSIWNLMPRPVQLAMNAVGGIIEAAIQGVLNRLADLVDGIASVTGWASGALGKIGINIDVGNIAQQLRDLGANVDLTGEVKAGGGDKKGITGLGAMLAGTIGFVADAATKARGPILDLGLDLGGGGAGGGLGDAAAGAAVQVNQAEVALRELSAAYELWRQTNQGTIEQFVARVELAQEEAALDRELADAQFRANIETEKARDSTTGLRMALKEMALEAINSGRTITEVARDAFRALVDQLESAFDSLFSSPTKEGAQLDLRLAELEYEKAKRKAAGASEDEIDAINRRIDAVREDKDVLDKHANLLKAQMTAADQSLITEEQRTFSAKLLIYAMNTQSATLGRLNDQAGLEAAARAHMIDAMLGAADVYNAQQGISQGDSNRQFFDSLPAEERERLARWLEHLASIGALAEGTSFWRGGPAIVGERGWEIVDLPAGSRVTPHDEAVRSGRVGRGGNAGGTTTIHNVNIYGDAAAGAAALGLYAR